MPLRSQNFSYLRPNIPPFTFGVLSRSLTKILEVMGRIKAKWSPDNEGSISEDKNLYVLLSDPHVTHILEQDILLALGFRK